MTGEDVLAIFEDCAAVLRNGHFVYTSGRHGAVYVNKDAIYARPIVVAQLCDALAEQFLTTDVDIVAGPAIGGVVLAHCVARALTASGIYVRNPKHTGEMLAVYAEQVDGAFVFKRGYDRIVRDQHVLIVEDVITTGGTVSEVVRAVCRVGGLPVGIGCLCNRGGVAAVYGVPVRSLCELPLESYAAAECPLCVLGVPISTTVGKGSADHVR